MPMNGIATEVWWWGWLFDARGERLGAECLGAAFSPRRGEFLV